MLCPPPLPCFFFYIVAADCYMYKVYYCIKKTYQKIYKINLSHVKYLYDGYYAEW